MRSYGDPISWQFHWIADWLQRLDEAMECDQERIEDYIVVEIGDLGRMLRGDFKY